MAESIRDARAAVLAERERIQSSIRDLEAKLSEADAALASLDRLMADARSTRGGAARRGPRAAASSNGRRRPRGTAAARRRVSRDGSPSMVSLIESFLEGQGRKATHADEIMVHLGSMQRQPGGKNPKGTLRTTLAQMEKRGRVKNIGRNRWRVARSSPSGARSAASAGGQTEATATA